MRDTESAIDQKIPKGKNMSTEIKTKLSQYIAKEILKNPKRVIKDDEAIISSGMIDSFHLVDLSLFVENEFGVRIDDSELNKETFDTLDQLTALIESRK
jgi:acyl carrier protein